jgi:hypothetical protein
MKASYKLFFLFTVALLQFSCEAEDPFLDRGVAPLLVLLAGDDGVPSSGLTTEPTVKSAISQAATFSVKLYELDKSGILNNSIGIDSVAASGVVLEVKYRAGGTITTATTNASGVATFSIPWSELGITSPSSSSSVLLNCSGAYKEKTFTKLFRIAGK